MFAAIKLLSTDQIIINVPPSWLCVTLQWMYTLRLCPSNQWILVNLSLSTMTKMTEWAIMWEFFSRWQQTASSLQLHINGVISEHSVHGERPNKMGQATLEVGCWLTSISSYLGALISYYYREALDKQINKQLPLGSVTKLSDRSAPLFQESSMEGSFSDLRWTLSSLICWKLSGIWVDSTPVFIKW